MLLGTSLLVVDSDVKRSARIAICLCGHKTVVLGKAESEDSAGQFWQIPATGRYKKKEEDQ